MSNACNAKNFVPPHTLWRWNFFNWMVPILLAALLLGLFGFNQRYARIQGPTIQAGPPDATTSLSGIGTPHSMVKVFNDGVQVGTTGVDADGNWSLDTTTITDSGDYEYVARAFDPDGVQRGQEDSWAFSIGDPVADELDYRAPTLALKRNGNDFVLAGTGSPGTTVEVFNNGISLGMADVDNDGNWSLTTVTDPYNGSFVASGTAPDGSDIGDSETLTYTPAALSAGALSLIGATYMWGGTGEPGTDVAVMLEGEPVGTARVDSRGNWSFTGSARDLDPGDYTLAAMALDGDGNDVASADKDALLSIVGPMFTADDVDQAADESGFVWSGTGDPGSDVAIMLDGDEIGRTTVDDDGNWTYEGDTTGLDAGDYELMAQMTDADGTVGGEAVAAAPISVVGAMSAFTAGAVAMADGAPSFTWSGTGDPGSDVAIMLDGDEIGRTTVDDNGDWTYEGDTTELDAGDYELMAQMTDADGTVGGEAVAATPLSVAGAMSAFTAGAVTMGDDNANFTWSGVGTPGSEVVIMLDGEEIGRTTVDDDGNWAYEGDTAGLDAGDHELMAQIIDADGTVGGELVAETPISVVGAMSAFTAGPVTMADDNANFTWSGTGTPGSEVVIMLGDEEIGRTTVDDNGDWTYKGALSDLDPGDYELSAQMADDDSMVAVAPFTIDGNVMGSETEFELGIGEPALADDGANFTWSGTGIPGSEIVIMVDGVEVGRTTVDEDGNWVYEGDAASLGAGEFELAVQMLDADGAVVSEMVATAPLSIDSGTVAADDAMGQVEVLLPNADADAGVAGTAPAGSPAVSLILDSSWSMTFGVDYTGQDVGPNTDESQRLTANNPNSRIAVAKAGLVEFIETSMPEGTPTALRVFGNLQGNLQCQTDLMVAYGPLDTAEMVSVIGDVSPAFNANTTIARSLELVREDLADAPEGNRNIVLVTDGDETCGGDPQAVIESLADQGFNTTVNIIGFSINDSALKSKLEGWAEAGNGKFYDAADADGLAESLRTAFAVRYVINDANGDEVASGFVGGEPVKLPVGEYTVVLGTTPAQEFDIEVTTDETTTVMAE